MLMLLVGQSSYVCREIGFISIYGAGCFYGSNGLYIGFLSLFIYRLLLLLLFLYSSLCQSITEITKYPTNR